METAICGWALNNKYCTCGFGDDLYACEGDTTYCIICNREVMPSEVKEAQLKKKEDASLRAKGERSILIVDDQDFFRKMLGDILITNQCTAFLFRVDTRKWCCRGRDAVIRLFSSMWALKGNVG